jgi:hypothetical protein
MYTDMKEGFYKQTFIGDNSWMTSLISAAVIVFLFWIPDAIWDNGFTGFLYAIGYLIGYFWPVIICGNADIGEHEDIKMSAEEDYEAIVKRYEVHHPSKRAVFWITLLTGWSIIGWLIANYMASSKKTITLPDRMVDELNSLAGIRTSHPPVHTENIQPNYVDETAATIPAQPIRLNGVCKSCSARYNIFLEPGDYAECDHCGTPIGS